MPVSPADFALWARATGNKYPETAEEKLAAAPHAYEYAKNLGKTGQNPPANRVGGTILYHSPESVQNPSPNSVFDAPVTPDNDAPKVRGTVDRTLTSEQFVNQQEHEAQDSSRTRQIIDVVGKTALAAGTLAAGVALARNPSVQQAVSSAGTTLKQNAQDIGSRVSSFLGGFGGQQQTNSAVVRNSGDITPPTTGQQYQQQEIPGLTQFAQTTKTAQVNPLTQSEVISTSQTFKPTNVAEPDPWTDKYPAAPTFAPRGKDTQLHLFSATADPWTGQEYTPTPSPSQFTQRQLASTYTSDEGGEYTPKIGNPYTIYGPEYERTFGTAPKELQAARRAISRGEPNPLAGAPLVDPFTGEIRNPTLSVPGYNETFGSAQTTEQPASLDVGRRLASAGVAMSGAPEDLGGSGVSLYHEAHGRDIDLNDPASQIALAKAGVSTEEALGYWNQKLSSLYETTAPVSQQTSDLIPNASSTGELASVGERAANFLANAQQTPEVGQAQPSVFDVQNSSAVRFFSNERQKIATELMNQGEIVTPMRVETELSRRLGSNASEYGSKYTARRQGLELYAQTGDPRLLNKIQRFGLAPVTFETFETMPAAKRAGFETAAPFTTDYYPSEEVTPVGLSSGVSINVPGEGSVSLASLRKPVITESTALAAENFIKNAKQAKLNWLSNVEKEVSTLQSNIFNERRARAQEIGTKLNAELAQAQAAGDIGKAEQLQTSLQALRNIYRNPEMSMHREGEIRQSNARLAGARRSTEQQIAGLQKKFPTTIDDWSGEAKRFYGEVDPSTGEIIPETAELRSERKTADLPAKGGGGRNIAEYTAGERLHEEIRRLQSGGRMRDYDETGAPVQHWVGDNTQTGREIDDYGVRLSSERPADPGLRPSEPQYRPGEIRSEAVRMASADPHGDVPVAPEYEDVVESLGRYQGSRTRQQRMRAADVSETIRKIQASGRPTAQQEVRDLLSSLAAQKSKMNQ